MRARPQHAGLRRIGVVLAAAFLSGAGVGVGQGINATGAAAATPRASAPPVRSTASHGRLPLHPAAGITLWRQRFTAGPDHPERAVLMRVDLRHGSGLHVGVAIPQEVIGGPRRTVAAQADATGAGAGINGDWFDMTTTFAVPRGAVIRGGRVLKTARPGWRANLTVGADGTAAIGAIRFHGAVRAGRSHLLIASINTPWDAAHGHLTYLTHSLVGLHLHRPCTVAYGRGGPARRTITAVDVGATSPPRVAPGHWALAACGGYSAVWLRRHLSQGQPVALSLDFPDGKPATALSGGRMLVHDAAPFVDVGGQRLWGANPETFACVSRSGRSLLLGVVDGRSARSWGVTQPQLSRYLVRLHCWDAMTFDGGGSTTLVARVPSASGPAPSGVTVLNRPSDGRPRKVADGLFVYAGGTATRPQ